MRKVAIVGAGLAGLSAAHRLLELSQASGRPLEVIVLELSGRCGGLLGTERIGEYLVDTGADSFLTTKPAMLDLCQRIGLSDQIVGLDQQHRGALVLRKGRPVPVPAGFALMVPARAWPIIASPIFSPWGKVRLLAERWVPKRTPPAEDESLSEFATRRFGREALDRLIQPLVGGIYTSDPTQLSLAATLPRFLEQEQRFGSVTAAARWERQSSRGPEANGARYGLFAALRGGIGQAITRLAAIASGDGPPNSPTSFSRLELNTRVESLHRDADDRWSLTTSVAAPERADAPAGKVTQERTFDALILATPIDAAGSLLGAVDPTLAQQMRQIESASSAILVTGHRLADVANPLDAYGLVIPEVEQRKILAVSFASRKFPERAPAGHVQLRTFIGGDLHPEALERSDEELTAIALEELRATLGVRGTPDFVRVVRYPSAMPQYRVGHLRRVADITARIAAHPRLDIAGNGLTGVGLPDVVISGERAAERTLAALSELGESR